MGVQGIGAPAGTLAGALPSVLRVPVPPNGHPEYDSACPTGKNLFALDLVQAAPDSMGLPDADRIFETLLPDRAALADLFGTALTFELLFFALELGGRKEHS